MKPWEGQIDGSGTFRLGQGTRNGMTMKALKGHLLIALPAMPDDDFAQTVTGRFKTGH